MVNPTGIEFGIITCISLSSIISNIALIKMVVSLLVVLTLVVSLLASISWFSAQIEGKCPVLILMSCIGTALLALDAKLIRFTALSKTELGKWTAKTFRQARPVKHTINEKQPCLN